MTKTMKKYFILISAALLSLACTKEIVDEQEVYDGEYKTITFESVMTKTTLAESGEVAWEAGDQISVYYVAEGVAKEAVATASAAGATSTFTTQIPIEDNPTEYYAAYPAGSGVLEVVEGVSNFYVDVQGNKCDGSFKSANFAAAHTSSDAMSFQFHNAVGMIRIALPQGGTFTAEGVTYAVKGIYMRGQSEAFDGKNCTGPVLFNPADGTFGDATTVTVDEVEYKGAANINLQNKTFTSEVIASGYAYVPTLPGTWPTGLCVCYYADYDEKEGAALPAVLSKQNSITIDRGEILKLEDLTSKVQFNYYVSPDGDGDGLTSANPMSLTKMQEMISATADYQYNVFVLRGATINLADGIYKITNTLTIPTPKTAYTLNIKGNNGKAILDGGTVSTGSGDTRATVTSNGKQILVVNTSTNVHIDGLTFQNGYAANGAAVDLVYTAKTADSNSSIEFHNCKFLRNISNNAGGAILIRNAAAGGIVKFNQCYFKDNQTMTGGEGGTLYTNGGKAAVMFNKCTFHKNKGRTGGLEIHMNNAGARLGMNNCTINGYNYDENVDKGVMANGALVCNKGYSIVVNSTLWNSKYNGDWGNFALGSAVANAATNGAKLVNSVFRNAKTQNGIYVAGNYHLNVRYCIYTGLKEGLNSPVSGTTYFVDQSYDLGLAGAVSGAAGVDKTSLEQPYYAYKWTWVDGYPCPTLAQVREEIKTTAGIGEIFLNWLDTLEEALTTDIAGQDRDEDAMCPGSYQQTDTPASN